MTALDDPHSPRRSWRGLAATGLVGLLAAGVYAHHRAPESELRSATTPRDAKPRALTPSFQQMRFQAAGSERDPCSFRPGTRMAYTVHTRTEIELDMDEVSAKVDLGAAQGQAAVETSEATARTTERDWLLELEAVARDDDGASVLAARITDQGIEASGRERAPEASAGLGQTFLIRVDPRCSIREFGWRAEAELDGVREQQLMAAGLGFWTPRSLGEAVSYGETSFDATGSYQTNYVYQEGGQIRGEIVRYAAAQLQIQVLASTVEVELEPGEWFGALTNERDLVLRFHGVEFGTHFRSTKATRTALGGFAPAVELDDGGWRWGRAPRAAAEPRHDFDPRLAELSLDDALAEYRELVADGSVSHYGPLLRDWLRANPEQTGRLVAELEAGAFEASQKARGGIFYALGNAGTAQARTALVELVSGPDVRPRNQIAAAHTLARTDEPSTEILDALREAANSEGLHEIERGSLLIAVGTFAKQSADHDPELAAAARAEIATWLETPGEDRAGLRHSLAAAGNAGHDELAPSIARYIDHEDPAVRRTATEAMRHMSPELAYPELERGLGDEDRVVRTHALETARHVAGAHEQQPSEALTQLAIDSLASEFGAERHAALGLLDEAAARGNAEASEALRAELERGLARNDGRTVAALGQTMSGHWTPN